VEKLMRSRVLNRQRKRVVSPLCSGWQIPFPSSVSAEEWSAFWGVLEWYLAKSMYSIGCWIHWDADVFLERLKSILKRNGSVWYGFHWQCRIGLLHGIQYWLISHWNSLYISDSEWLIVLPGYCIRSRIVPCQTYCLLSESRIRVQFERLWQVWDFSGLEYASQHCKQLLLL
jgi:hypothetical protein